ncbi:MAG: glycosyltransferase family 4 protein [Candidatus Paceibacterota bacterium]
MKKKILYLITKSNYGGAQKYVYDLAINLPQADYNVSVATGGTGDSGTPAGVLVEKLHQHHIKTFFLTSLVRDISIFNEFLSLIEIFKLIKKNKPDILHVNSSKTGGLGALCGRLLQVPNIIYTVHGWPFNEPRPRLIKILILFFSWLTCLLAHKVIVINQNNFNQGLKLWGLKNKFKLIYNGLKPIEFLPKTEAREVLNKYLKQSLSTQDIIVGTIAELHPNKNLTTLIKSVSNVPNIKTVIIGSGQEKDKLTQTINDNNQTQNIQLGGFILDASYLLKAFDVFILPSFKEGHPYVILEAGLAGLPVIGSNISGIRDIIIDNKNGLLFSPESVTDLTDKINYLTLDPKKRLDLGRELEMTIKEKYTFDSFLNQTLSLY